MHAPHPRYPAKLGLLLVAALVLACAPIATAQEAQLTPVGMRVDIVPIPVKGSDGAFHVVYEIAVTNFSDQRVTLNRIDVIDARRDRVAATVDAEALAGRLVVRDSDARPGILGPAQAGLVYMHLIFPTAASIPRLVDHRLSVVLRGQTITNSAARTQFTRPTRLVLDPPLRGPRLIAAD